MSSTSPRLVVVTGAGSGIGAAIAKRFAKRGAEVVGCDIDYPAVQATAAAIASEGGRAHAYRLDVTDSDAWKGFAEGVRSDHGVPDVLVNNAGILISGGFLDHDRDDWERIVQVNLMGVVHGCRVFGAQMVERGQGGQIVNIASTAAFLPLRPAPAYAVTKAAVLMLSECLRIELASQGIGVTAICPTVIRTNIAAHSHIASVDPDTEARMIELSARIQRFAGTSPNRVARAVERSVRHNWAIVPVNPDAWLIYFLQRLAPGLIRSVARLANPELARRRADARQAAAEAPPTTRVDA